MTLQLVETKPTTVSYLERTDLLLATRICIVWAADPTKPGNNGTRITPTSYLLGLTDAFGSCGNVEAAHECSFLLEIYHRKLQEQRR